MQAKGVFIVVAEEGNNMFTSDTQYRVLKVNDIHLLWLLTF